MKKQWPHTANPAEPPSGDMRHQQPIHQDWRTDGPQPQKLKGLCEGKTYYGAGGVVVCCKLRPLFYSASIMWRQKRLARERVGRQASRPAGRHQDSASKATPISGHLEAMPSIYAWSWSQLDSDMRLLSSSTRFWPRDQPHLSLPPTTTTTPTLLRPLVLPKNTNRGNGHGLKKISKRFLICNHFVNGIINM